MWVSPRKCNEVARRSAGRHVSDAEGILGRSLTAEEMRTVYADHAKAHQVMGRRARAAAEGK